MLGEGRGEEFTILCILAAFILKEIYNLTLPCLALKGAGTRNLATESRNISNTESQTTQGTS